MNTPDLIILIVLLIAGFNGLRLGFVKSFANLIGWVVALIMAAKYAVLVAPVMSFLSQDPVVQKIAAFAFIVVLIIVLTWIVSSILNRILKTIKLGLLDRLAGAGLGTLKGLFVVLITMQGLQPWVSSSPTWKQSRFIQTLLPFAPFASALSKEAANEALHQMRPQDSQKQNSISDSDTSTSAQDGKAEHSTQNPFY